MFGIKRQFAPVVAEAHEALADARSSLAAVVLFTAAAALCSLLTLLVVLGRG